MGATQIKTKNTRYSSLSNRPTSPTRAAQQRSAALRAKAVKRQTLRKRVALYFAVSAVVVSGSFMVVSAQSAPGRSVLHHKSASDASATLGASTTAGTGKSKDQAKEQAARNSRRSTNTAKKSKAASAGATTDAKKAAATTAAGGVATASLSTNASAKPVTVPTPVAAPTTVAANVHADIVTTYFWAGEAADASNAGISNTPSAWDDIWSTHYGGYDDPLHRNGSLPAAFTPKENPFYFALPYNDYDANGNRRPDASKCSAVTGVKATNTSWCKNAWIKITKGTKTAYAQWEDVGPMNEDDSAYVFGTAKPKNTWDSKAGLDVSPAARDYLGLQDVDKTSWTFVSAASVPAGPWKQIITTSGVYWP